MRRFIAGLANPESESGPGFLRCDGEGRVTRQSELFQSDHLEYTLPQKRKVSRVFILFIINSLEMKNSAWVSVDIHPKCGSLET